MSDRLFHSGWVSKNDGILISQHRGAKPVLSSSRGGSVPSNLRRTGILRQSKITIATPPSKRHKHFNVPIDQVMSKGNLPGHVLALTPGHTFGETTASSQQDMRLSNPARQNTPQTQIFSESALHLSGEHVNIGNNKEKHRFDDFSQYYTVLVGTLVSTDNPAIAEVSESCNFYTGLTDKQAIELKTLVKNKIATKNAFDEVSVVQFLTSLYYSNQSLNKVGLIELIEDLGAAYIVTDPLRLIKERNKRNGLNIYGEPLDVTSTKFMGKPPEAPRRKSREPQYQKDVPAKEEQVINRLSSPDPLPLSSSISSVLRQRPDEVSIGVGSINIADNLDDAESDESPSLNSKTMQSNNKYGLRLNLLPNAPPLMHESLLLSSRRRSPSIMVMGTTPRPDTYARPTYIEGSIPPQSDIDLMGGTPRVFDTQPIQHTNNATSPVRNNKAININYAEASGLLGGPDKSGISLVTEDCQRVHNNFGNYTLNYLTGLESESIIGYDGPPDTNKEPYVIGRYIDPYEN